MYYITDLPNSEPHELTRKLVSEYDTMPASERRVVFQALPLSDAQWLCHLLSQHRPHLFKSPDQAWQWFLMVIEPDPWDIKPDVWQSGDHYVAYFGGQAVMAHDRTRKPEALQECYESLMEWFDALYPKHLIDRYTQPVEVTHVSSYS